jgi:hypothetical protein
MIALKDDSLATVVKLVVVHGVVVLLEESSYPISMIGGIPQSVVV